jgi:hypothetical protein
MKVLFVTGCPRSGTSFYGIHVLKNVQGFYVTEENNEPSILHDAQYYYMSNHKNYQIFLDVFMKFLSDTYKKLENPEDWIVIKQPYFSYILPEISALPIPESKILITQRPFEEIFNSRMNFKNSISQVIDSYESTWLKLYGLDLSHEWEAGSIEDRMKIYITNQQKIEKDFMHLCIQIQYGNNLAFNKKFVAELKLSQTQIININNNFTDLWQDEGFKEFKIKNKIDAEKFIEENNIKISEV